MIEKSEKTDMVVIFSALFLSLVLGMIVGFNMKLVYELNTFKQYSWENPPNIVNCYGKEFSEQSIKRAMTYWTRKGEKFGFYEHRPPKNLCDKKYIPGFIILKKVKKRDVHINETALAATIRQTSFLNIISSIIYYKEENYKLHLLNEHELGHALGYAHVKKAGHIMHPSFSLMGPNFYVP